MQSFYKVIHLAPSYRFWPRYNPHQTLAPYMESPPNFGTKVLREVPMWKPQETSAPKFGDGWNSQWKKLDSRKWLQSAEEFGIMKVSMPNFLECLACWPKFSIKLSQTQPIPERNSSVNSKSFSNIPETWFNFIRRLGEMGKLIYSDNEIINLCELLRPTTFKL